MFLLQNEGESGYSTTEKFHISAEFLKDITASG
jgi:hypothetical protein